MKNKKSILIFAAGALSIALSVYLANIYSVDAPKTPLVINTTKIEPKKPIQINLPEFELNMPALENLNAVTQKIVDLSSGLTNRNRSDLVALLKNEKLTKDDFQAFYTFLKINPSKDGPQLAWHSLKNDLLIFVINDGRYKEATGQLMIDIINDSQQHEIMREYVLQYTTDYFERHWLSVIGTQRQEKQQLSNIDIALRDKMLETMWNNLNSNEGPIAGTSLIRLNDLAKNFSCINTDRIDEETERLSLDASVPTSSRMAAFSVAGERELFFLSSKISDIAFDDNNSLSLRMSALHTAYLLNPDEDFIDRLNLEIINNSDANQLLKRAAKMTLNKLNKTRG